MKKDTSKLITLLGSFILLWILSAAFSLQILWFITVNLSALYIIWKYKDFNIQDIVMGALFGILCIPSSIIMGISVILPYISARMIFKTSKNKIVLFGLPFALMQRKFNLISAIGSHAFVDFVRFCVLGV